MVTLLRTTIVLASVAAASPAAAQWPGEVQPTAGWTVTPGLLVTSTWDDNALILGRDDNVHDFVNTINPRVDVDFRGRRGQLGAAYDGSFSLYRDLTSLNSYDQHITFDGQRLLTRHVTVSVVNQLTNSPTTELIQLIGVPFARIGSTIEYVRAGVDAALSNRTSIASSYSFQVVRFDQGPTVPYRLPGGHGHGASFTFRRALSRRATATADYDLQHALVAERQEVFDIHRTEGGMEYRLDERLRVFGAFGFSRLTVSNVAPARTGPSWRTGLRGDFEGWTGEATYSRSFVPSYGFGGTQQNEELMGRVHVPLSRSMYAESSLWWRINEPLTVGGLKLHSLSVQGVFGYAFARWARVEGFYDQGSQNIDRPGGAVRRHRIGGQILTTRPMRIR